MKNDLIFCARLPQRAWLFTIMVLFHGCHASCADSAFVTRLRVIVTGAEPAVTLCPTASLVATDAHSGSHNLDPELVGGTTCVFSTPDTWKEGEYSLRITADGHNEAIVDIALPSLSDAHLHCLDRIEMTIDLKRQ